MYSREKTQGICCAIVYVNSISLMNTLDYHSKWVKSWMCDKERCIHVAVRIETKNLTTRPHHEYNPCVYVWRAEPTLWLQCLKQVWMDPDCCSICTCTKLSSQIRTESQDLSVKLFAYSCLMCRKFESGPNVDHGVLIPLFCAFQVWSWSVWSGRSAQMVAPRTYIYYVTPSTGCDAAWPLDKFRGSDKITICMEHV
jgi:hypothetical protein